MILLLDLLSYRLLDKNIGLSNNPIEYFQEYIGKTQEELEKTKEPVPHYFLLLYRLSPKGFPNPNPKGYRCPFGREWGLK